MITAYELDLYYRARIFEQLETQIQETEYFLSTLAFPANLTAQNYQTLVNFSHTASIRLTPVLINLIQNAINYNKDGGIVKVGYVELDKKVRIYVSDTGQGINEDHIPRIFERFYRVDNERSRSVGGTGLGLTIVKHIIEAHKSKVNVESKVGVGSTFSFVLQKK